MKGILRQVLLIMAAMLLTCCSKDSVVTAQTTMEQKLYITIDSSTMPVTLVDNTATRELVAALQQGDITYEAHDYGGFEKVGALGRSLTASDTQITTQAGDVILYNSNNIVLFYGSNTWSYTRIGSMEYGTLDELKSFLKVGQGNVSVKLSLTNATTSINQVQERSKAGKESIYSLNGIKVDNPTKGLYIKNGKVIRL